MKTQAGFQALTLSMVLTMLAAGDAQFASAQGADETKTAAIPAAGVSGNRPGTVVLNALPEQETGLQAIMEKWKADELARHGGKWPPSHGWWPWSLVAFDYDNDGDLDLLAQQHGAPQSIVIKNQLKETGKLAFVNANPELGLPGNGLAGCFTPRVWDFDGDGFLDLAYCDALPNTCFFNAGAKKFEPMGFAFGQLAGISEPRDVNGDGYLDTTSINDGALYAYDPATRKFKRQAWEDPLHANPPEPVKAAMEPLVAQKKITPRYLRFAEGIDLNGDGIPDLAAGYFGSYGGPMFARYLLGDKDGKFADATDQLGLPREATPILFQDFNGDGKDDVLIVGAGLYLSDSQGRFTLKPGPLTNFLKRRVDYIHQARRADFANAGRVDLVVHNGRGGTVKIYEDRGGGDFAELLTVASGWVDAVAVCDINNDGLTDVCVGGPGDAITVYVNRTPSPGDYCDVFPRMDKPNWCAAAASVEAFKAGDLGKPGARPFVSEKAHPDATPIHVGLASAKTFDLRVTFPGKQPTKVEIRNVEAKHRLSVTPDGKVSELK